MQILLFHVNYSILSINYCRKETLMPKKYVIEDRVLREASYLIENEATIRATALALNEVSKSTVYKDLAHLLPTISLELYNQVKTVLEKNKKERAMRGGMATQKKYAKNT